MKMNDLYLLYLLFSVCLCCGLELRDAHDLTHIGQRLAGACTCALSTHLQDAVQVGVVVLDVDDALADGGGQGHDILGNLLS